MTCDGFARHLIDWQAHHGRHDLPWQGTRDPYRVWLSEIMLQQTQVRTVLNYYPRFLAHFPDVSALAHASQAEVLALWSGMGYYSRARNLHRCAQVIATQWQGHFPTRQADLAQLPGIGPSTAAAIAAFCFHERVSILDGNVQRVLTRYLGFDQDLAIASAKRNLWAIAQTLLPTLEADMPPYTQGLMDLGALVCTRANPHCSDCPLQAQCVAHQTQMISAYPRQTKRLKRGQQNWWLWHITRSDGAVCLVQRPQTGIWAGLYSFPIFTSQAALAMQMRGLASETMPMKKHVLTHQDLFLYRVCTSISFAENVASPLGMACPVPDPSAQWFFPSDWAHLGLPQPVSQMLKEPQP
jgi:A/G-specific adenine glycosylase